MASPLLRWFVLGFACLWFGMLVPVHQRGQIQLPGTAAAAEEAEHCRVGSACHKKQPAPGKDAPPAPKSNCAVCHFIAGLHAPPAAVAYEARLGLTRERPVDAVATLPVRHAALPFHGLDPPTV